MSWDAGAITGQMILETGQFTGPIRQAMTQAVQAGQGLHDLESAAAGVAAPMDRATDATGRFVSAAAGLQSPVSAAVNALHEASPAAERAGSAMNRAGEAAHGFGGDLLHAMGVMEAFRVASEVMFELPLRLIEKGFELAKEAAEKFFETIGEAGDVAQKMGLEALKAGVDVSFFSQISEAAKRVGIDAGQLGQSFKFLQKNAVDALTGMNQEAMGGFAALGLSTEFLKEHLNDTQGLFTAVKEKIGELPDAAERMRVAMQILGRSGSDMIPLFVQSNKRMQDSIDLATRLGAVMDQSSVEGAEGWVQAKAAFSDMWEGISKAVAEPVLEYLTTHWKDVRAATIAFADAAVELIPPAMTYIGGSMVVFTEILKQVLTGMEGLLQIADYFGVIRNDAGVHIQSLVADLDKLENGMGEVIGRSRQFRQEWRDHAHQMTGFDTGQGGPRTINNQIQLNVIGEATPQAVGDAARRELESRNRKQRGAAARGHVAHATGGKAPGRLFGAL